MRPVCAPCICYIWLRNRALRKRCDFAIIRRTYHYPNDSQSIKSRAARAPHRVLDAIIRGRFRINNSINTSQSRRLHAVTLICTHDGTACVYVRIHMHLSYVRAIISTIYLCILCACANRTDVQPHLYGLPSSSQTHRRVHRRGAKQRANPHALKYHISEFCAAAEPTRASCPSSDAGARLGHHKTA